MILSLEIFYSIRYYSIMARILHRIAGLWLGLLTVFHCTPLRALDPVMEIGQYNLEVYSTENGLPQSSVLSIIQTSDGYLCMATYEGIARFDGVRFTIFDKSNTPEINSNRIRCLFEDSKKNIWVGTYGDGIDTASRTILSTPLHGTKKAIPGSETTTAPSTGSGTANLPLTV